MATKKNEIATLDSFSLTNIYDGMDADELAELQDELDDLGSGNEILCRMIKVPSGGQLAFEVETDNPESPDYQKEVQGVILFTHKANARWLGRPGDGAENSAPVCSSLDGKTGMNMDTGEVINCDGCPYNEFGSSGDGTRGKECKNMRRVYLMMDGDPNVYRLTVPPTSIKDIEKQLRRIIAGGASYTSVVVRFTLSKATNNAGIAYSKAGLEKVGPLPPAVAATAKELRKQIKAQFQSMDITAADYNTTASDTAPAYPEASFEEVPEEAADEPLPFG